MMPFKLIELDCTYINNNASIKVIREVGALGFNYDKKKFTLERKIKGQFISLWMRYLNFDEKNSNTYKF